MRERERKRDGEDTLDVCEKLQTKEEEIRWKKR